MSIGESVPHTSTHAMHANARPLAALAILLLAAFAGAVAVGPIVQNAAYHHFADQRVIFGVPNLLDVASNAAFLVVGLLGIAFCAGPRRPSRLASWRALFIGATLTGLGSAYYHWSPNDATLVWDRLPMTLGFMGLLVALLAENIDERLERYMLAPALVIGIASVLWWMWTGDLRFYYCVQYAPLLAIPLVLALYPARHSHRRFLFYGLGLYGLAKAAELGDRQIFALTGEHIAGHTLKHLLAAGAILALLAMLRRRRALGA